jgi:hypothetical protein
VVSGQWSDGAEDNGSVRLQIVGLGRRLTTDN